MFGSTDFSGKKVLIVGDILHSRVARSTSCILTKLGADVGVLGPGTLVPENRPEEMRKFAGFDEAASNYDKTAWDYERGADNYVFRDESLQHPRAVFQLLKQHYDRYTPDVVADITGCTEAGFLEMAEIICSTGRADRVGTIMYAVGWAMHTVGSQIIRTAAILQLLLGNIGRPGGGINALRGHANVQGATDHAIVAGILPGYLKVPTPPQTSLAHHLDDSTPRPLVRDTVNYWGNYPKFYVSQMKAWFGEHATPENDFAYHYLAKQGEDATWLTIWDKARQGTLEGFVALGFNPLLAGPDVPRLLDSICLLYTSDAADE